MIIGSGLFDLLLPPPPQVPSTYFGFPSIIQRYSVPNIIEPMLCWNNPETCKICIGYSMTCNGIWIIVNSTSWYYCQIPGSGHAIIKFCLSKKQRNFRKHTRDVYFIMVEKTNKGICIHNNLLSQWKKKMNDCFFVKTSSNHWRQTTWNSSNHRYCEFWQKIARDIHWVL